MFTDTPTTPAPEVTMNATIPTNARPAHLQVLSALDFGARPGGPAPDLDALIEDMGDALHAVITHEVPHWRNDGRMNTEHLLVFDADALRNTHAHGMGYRRGFVVCIRSGDAEVEAALALVQPLDPAAQRRAALADLHAAEARRTLRDTLRRAAHDFGVLYITVCLPQPWGAAQCWADGRVTNCRGEVDGELTALVAS